MANPRSGTGRSLLKVAEAAAKLVRSKVLKKDAPAGAKAVKPKATKTSAKPAAKAAKSKPAAKAAKAAAPVKAAVKKVASAVAGKKAAPPAKAAPAAKAPAAKAPAAKAPAAKAPAAKAPAAKVAPAAAEKPAKGAKGKGAKAEPAVPATPPVPTALPRATKLPPMGEPLNKREIEQLLTAGAGRGVFGEGSLKGKLVVKEGFPYLIVSGRDKRELQFLLQGPDQEVLPAYTEHKVSVTGMVRKTSNYGGTVDVRKWSAKKPEAEAAAPEPAEQKLRYLSPGEVEQLCTGGMGAGLIGFARFNGTLEMTGDDFFLVVSGGGTRQQVSFLLEGKGAKGLRKHVGQTLTVTGVVEKASGWGGKLNMESFEARANIARISRDNMSVSHVDGLGAEPTTVEVGLNQGMTVRLNEKAGYTWAIEPTSAKRIGLREANFEPGNGRPATREFFFTPRNPGTFEVEFFLARAFNPTQVSKSCKLVVTVKTQM